MQLSFFKEFTLLIIRILKITSDYMRGIWAFRRLDRPIVTILGGVRVKTDDTYSRQAFELAHTLALHGFTIITGGGPGIMVAANCGAAQACKDQKTNECKTLGVGLKSLDSGFQNPCAHVYKATYFFVRKWFLFHYSAGFVFFPGGIGTADELFELLNLVVFKFNQPLFIILVDKDYWQPLIDWYVQTGMKEDLINLPPHEAFIIVDSPEEAFSTILTASRAKTQSDK